MCDNFGLSFYWFMYKKRAIKTLELNAKLQWIKKLVFLIIGIFELSILYIVSKTIYLLPKINLFYEKSYSTKEKIWTGIYSQIRDYVMRFTKKERSISQEEYLASVSAALFRQVSSYCSSSHYPLLHSFQFVLASNIFNYTWPN